MSIRLTGILILLLALVAGLTFYLRANQSETEKERRPELWEADHKQIKRIEILLPREEKQIAFLLDKKEGEWFFDDYRKTPLDKKRWGGIVFLVANPKGKRKIADKMDNLEKYGLLNPRMVIALGLDGSDKTLEILIGDSTPQKDQYYVKLKHSHPVYLVNSTFVEVLERLVNDPPIHPLTKARDEELEKQKINSGTKGQH